MKGFGRFSWTDEENNTYGTAMKHMDTAYELLLTYVEQMLNVRSGLTGYSSMDANMIHLLK